ncbi:MAG: hypothetical protein ACTS6O_01330 [Giesbergeria sp.]
MGGRPVNTHSVLQEIQFMAMSFSRRRWMHLLGASALAAMASGCATGLGGFSGISHSQKDSEEAALLQRAQDYWVYMKANDRLQAWKYEVASQDQSLTLESYLKRGGIVYEAIEVRGVGRVEGDEAELEVWMRYSVPLLRIKGTEVTMRDQWRMTGGQWFHALPHNPLANAAK